MLSEQTTKQTNSTDGNDPCEFGVVHLIYCDFKYEIPKNKIQAPGIHETYSYNYCICYTSTCKCGNLQEVVNIIT